MHIERVDISFDHFRLRDAEFVYQIGGVIGHTVDSMKGTGWFQDTLAAALFRSSSLKGRRGDEGLSKSETDLSSSSYEILSDTDSK